MNDFAAIERFRVPPYLRSRGAAPGRVRDYQTTALQRWRDAGRRLSVSFIQALVISAAICVLLGLVGHSYYDRRAAREDYVSIGNLPERIELFDTTGGFVGAIPWSSTRRSISSAKELPPYLIDELTTMEDRRFFVHAGVNWNGVARAIAHNAKTLALEHGGSGITQQLAKMWKFGVPENETIWQKLDRKFLEWHLARKIEARYSKNEILCHYLNRIDFGCGFHGIYAAAVGFFGKVPKDLTIEESATLVAMLRGPGAYSPILHPDRTIARRNLVLRQLAQIHPDVLSAQQAARDSTKPLGLNFEPARRARIPDAISILARKELEELIRPEVLARGGLRVTLTINVEWNAAAAAIAERHLSNIEKRRRASGGPLQIAAVALDSKSGAIRLMLGGRPSAHDQFNRVTQSFLSPGSAIKPFGYCLLFEQGANPDDMISADSLRPGELSFGPPGYSPANSGGVSGTITLREALEKSVNTSAVRVGDKIGIEPFVEFLGRLGVARPSSVPRSPVAFLGCFGVRPIDLASGYTIFANNGVRCSDAHIVDEVKGKDGAVIFSFSKPPRRECSADAAGKTADCLRGVMTRGTAKSSSSLGLRRPALGKTGTTDAVKDVWFAGVSGDVTCVLWMGFDKPDTILNAYAAQLALPVWVQIMNSEPTNEIPLPKRTTNTP